MKKFWMPSFWKWILNLKGIWKETGEQVCLVTTGEEKKRTLDLKTELERKRDKKNDGKTSRKNGQDDDVQKSV